MILLIIKIVINIISKVDSILFIEYVNGNKSKDNKLTWKII